LRYIIQILNGRGLPGSPVLNEFGEIIGMIAAPSLQNRGGLVGFRAGPDQGKPVLPISLIRPSAAPAISILELRRRGDLMPPLGRTDNILSAGFARQIQRNPVRPIDQKEQFSATDGRFFVFATWDPKERVRGTMMFRIFDENNQLVAESKPGKVDFKPGGTTFSQWEAPVPTRPGNYRTDIAIGEVPAWRGFFRVTP
jgi:hypothetical protein